MTLHTAFFAQPRGRVSRDLTGILSQQKQNVWNHCGRPCSAQDHVRAPRLFEQLDGSGLLWTYLRTNYIPDLAKWITYLLNRAYLSWSQNWKCSVIAWWRWKRLEWRVLRAKSFDEANMCSQPSPSVRPVPFMYSGCHSSWHARLWA